MVIRKRISRVKMLEFFANLPPCLVGIEACPSAHHWGRELTGLGHTVKLMPPSYVKAYLKRSKNDANDAAAICEAVTRPSMRFVAIKTKEQQTALMLHRTRQLLVRQRTMLSNALRGHLAELGVVSAKGRNGTAEVLRIVAEAEVAGFPAARGILDVLARQYSAIGTEIGSIDKNILAWHRSCEASRRLAEIPGIGPIVATALVAEISEWKAFASGRNLAAWIGLGAQAAYDRWQGQARQHHQAGQPAMVAGRRRGHQAVAIFCHLNGDKILDVCHFFSYILFPNSRSCEGPAAEAHRGLGASAVPAGGVAIRSRAASGISLPALRTGARGARWTGTG